MKKEEYIKTFFNEIIGIVETDEKGNQTVRSFPGRQILGYYDASKNVTTDFFGKVISSGNVAVSLIYLNK